MHRTDWRTPDTYSLLARLLCLTSYITFKWDFSQCYLGNKLKISRQGLGLSLIRKALSVWLSGVWFCVQKGKSRYLSMGWGESPYGKLTPTGLIVSDCAVRCFTYGLQFVSFGILDKMSSGWRVALCFLGGKGEGSFCSSVQTHSFYTARLGEKSLSNILN